MLRHGADMQTAIEQRQSGKPTDEERQEHVAILWASFNTAQSAWDAYREHLTKHGLIDKEPETPRKPRQAAKKVSLL